MVSIFGANLATSEANAPRGVNVTTMLGTCMLCSPGEEPLWVVKRASYLESATWDFGLSACGTTEELLTTHRYMPDIHEQIGKQIRELRTTLKGQGISQEELAQAVDTTAQHGSRLETATYKPPDLEKLAPLFGVPITVFFPQAEPKSRTNALLGATADLDGENLEEVTLYA